MTISKRLEGIAEQQKKYIAEQASLLNSERRQFLIEAFQRSLSEAEGHFDCCSSCTQDMMLGVPLEQARRVEIELQDDFQWKPCTAELVKVAAFGSYVWDFDTVLDYCERSVKAAEDSVVPREYYLILQRRVTAIYSE